MKAVMPIIPPEFLAMRKRTEADQYDEMWNGVLHISPSRNRIQQDLEWQLEGYLREFWGRPRLAKVYHQINVASIGGWQDDYRIPDLVLLLPERFAIDRNEYFEGAPTAVVEIHSPGDESYDKLPFYAKVGVPEVWIIHRDTKAPEIHALRGKSYRKQTVVKGWLRGPTTKVELAHAGEGKLAIRVAGDDATRRELPEE